MDPYQRIRQSEAGHLWEKIGLHHHHGIALPLFCLHTQNSCGIGEYLDLIPMIDWCQSLHFDVIQLLPLNDTGDLDSPYSALSAFALNPLHISLLSLPHIEEHPDLLQRAREMHALCALQRVDYSKVRQAKSHFLHDYFGRERERVGKSEACQTFYKEEWWLKGYALFKAQKKREKGKSWREWPEEIRKPTTEVLDRLAQEHAEEIEYYSFLQYLCFTQLQAVKRHADTKGVFLKGDIPILIDRESADVWLYRSNFHLHYVAGSPPDPYAPQGQYWGFPTYNWNDIEEDQFFWWRKRLQLIERFYHIYRLDHIIGFFRMWSIPEGKSASEGYFIPIEKELWVDHGRRILSKILQFSSLLPIGEDLGFYHILPEMFDCMIDMGIAGTKVLRWYKFRGGTFIPIEKYPLVSMTTVSTHDFDPLELWWQNDAKEVAEFAQTRGWHYSPQLSRDLRKSILWESHHSNSLFHVNLLPEYLAYLPTMRWPDPEDERINVPGTISEKNWSYRCRPSVEELVRSDSLRKLMLDVSL